MNNTQKNGCGDDCGCDGTDMKKHHLHTVLLENWSDLPENIKDMLHSLSTQKLAVLNEIKVWADKNGKKDISDICAHKIERTKDKIAEMSK